MAAWAYRRWLRFVLFLFAMTLACRTSTTSSSGPEPSATAPTAVAAPKALEAVTLVIAYGSEKKTWLEEQVRAFEAAGTKTASGRAIKVDARAMGSGEALQAIVSGELKAHVYSPASGAYIALLNRTWLSKAGHTIALAPAGEPVVLSPVVIAMWRPMAEALGWPGKPLGWRELLKVNANPKGWGAYGHPEWGPFKLGHTHPEYSNSGLLAVLAEAYAGANKKRGLSIEDVKAKNVRSFIAGVEKTLVHYGKSTGFFSDKMLERGPTYLSAAVLYENLVIESYAAKKEAAFPIVAIYPLEGTFWSDHPYSVLDAPWVGAEEKDAGQKLLAFLKGRPQQERALSLGFRPADPAVHVASPIDPGHGADPKQPQALLELPDADTMDALIEAWRETKKPADVVLVFDKSGSMMGKPLAEAKAGADAFLDVLGDRDDVSIVFFDNTIYPEFGPMRLATSRPALKQRIDGAIAGGGTALYEVILETQKLALMRAQKEPDRIHAVVVMTDGKDESSKIGLGEVVRGLKTEDGSAPVKVFTIAYGKQAEGKVLDQIAEAAQGTSSKGSVETIVQVYRDMASFF